MYKKVELPKEGYVCMEKEVAELWKEKDIVKKNFNKNEGKKYFMFMSKNGKCYKTTEILCQKP